MTDYIISSKLSNETVYAYYRGRFWYWNGSIWKESRIMTHRFELARAADKKLTPQEFLTNGAEFAPLDEYEIDCAMLDALENAKPCRNAPIEPVEEEPECQTSTPAASPTKNSSAPAANADSSSVAPAVQSMTATEAVTFDFGADDQTNALLLQDAQTFITGNMARIMAAKHAHDLCANNKNGTWGKWCDVVGISRDTGDNMVHIAEQFGNIQIEGKPIFDVQPMKLLYAAAKPSAPQVLVEQVKSGDITSFKEYQELMAQLKAEKSRADAAEKSAQNARKENAYFKELVKSAEAQTSKDAKKREEAESRYESALADINGLKEQNAQLKERADSAEAREEEAWKMQSKAEARAKNAEDALKKQPIVGVTDPEEVRRQADALAAEAKAQAQRQVEDAQRRVREAEAKYQKLQQDADGFLAPEQSCAQQAKIIADSMRSMYLVWFGLASTTGTPLARMAAPIYQVCDEIRESLEEDTTINPTAEGSVEDAEREALFE